MTENGHELSDLAASWNRPRTPDELAAFVAEKLARLAGIGDVE